MYQIPFFIYDAFTDTPGQGNPAGVFFDDDAILTGEEMRRMSGEVSLESAFVTPAPPGSGADFALRYFTGAVEVPFCGHDTVATTVALMHAGRIGDREKGRITAREAYRKVQEGSVDPWQEIRYLTPIGLILVLIGARGTVTLVQKLPAFGEPADAELTARVAAALGCPIEAITATGLPVQVVSTGTPCLIVPVKDRATVDAAPADFGAILNLQRETSTFTMYVFTLDPFTGGIQDGASVWSRCFAPFAGLNEDPVTGSASGALGGYLVLHGCLERVRLGDIYVMAAHQGFGGGRGGTAEITVGRGSDGAIERICVTGKATLVAEGNFIVRR